jgi:Zn-dependent protease
MLLLLTSLWLVWWSATNVSTDSTFTVEFGLWGGAPPDIRTEVNWLTTALVAAPIPLLFLRVAAKSLVHEPRSWRRDVTISLVLVAVGLVSCWAWPIEVPFWGTYHYPGDPPQAITGTPGVGWLLALVAALLLLWALLLARPESGAPRLATTEK